MLLLKISGYIHKWVSRSLSLSMLIAMLSVALNLTVGLSTALPEPYAMLKMPHNNKGSSFSAEERERFKLRGLVPAGDPMTLETKLQLTMEQLRAKTSPLEKYIFLHTIQDADETLFYKVLTSHTAEVMPFVYTPVVGQACQEWGNIFRHVPRGLYLSLNDKGRIREVLDNYLHRDIKVIVVTDGERILGLGDLGTNGMGIPIGKLALYTACAGIDPSQTLPVHIDVGTNNVALRASPQYMGLRRERERGPAYKELLSEFVTACQDAYGKEVLIQFEDFGNLNAFDLLEEHRHSANCFNDDIQGTASVVLAGIMSSLPLVQKKRVADHTFLFHGAGEAGVGIANLVASAIKKETGCSDEESRRGIWLVDSKGLITATRADIKDMASHKVPFAHTLPAGAGGECAGSEGQLLHAVNAVRPTALLGVSAQGGAFTEEICRAMASINASPLIFALSNPTSKAECTARQAYEWTNGKCVFASGSPFDPVTLADGRTFTPGQGNNAYIFPAVGLAAVASGARTISDEDFYVAAAALASLVPPERLAQGCAYPELADIREVSLQIAAAVAENIRRDGRAQSAVKEGGYLDHCRSLVYVPKY